MAAPHLTALSLLSAAVLLPAGARAFDFAPNDRLTATIADGKLTPRRPGAQGFGKVPGRCPLQAPQAALAYELEELARSSQRAPILSDARLCAVAETFLSWEAKEVPSSSLAGFVLQHFGMLASFPRVVVLTIPEDDPRLVAQGVLETIGNYALNARRPRYGMMYQRLRKRSTRVAVALADEPPAEFTVPRSLAAGQVGKLDGKLIDDHDQARIYVSDPAGKLDTVEGDTSFATELRCGDRPGMFRVEIRGQLGGVPVLVSRFPVACGLPLDASASLAPPEPWLGDLAAQARRMVETINAERASAGAPALAWDAALAEVATGIAESIKLEVGRGAFAVPQDLAARLKKVGIGSPLVLQNPAQGRSVQEVMAQMAVSPGHRSSYLDPGVTNVGVGVASSADGQGRTAVFVDAIFIKELPPLDPVATREKLRTAVIQRRKDGRYPPASPDATLDEFAQTLAGELAAAAGNLPKARQAELTGTLDKRFKAVSLTFGARQEPLDFAEEPEVTAAGKHFGVGVALGMHEKLGRNAVYAVIAVGQERGGKDAEPAPAKKAKKK